MARKCQGLSMLGSNYIIISLLLMGDPAEGEGAQYPYLVIAMTAGIAWALSHFVELSSTSFLRAHYFGLL